MSKVTRPLLRYFGGKWQLRHWIIEHFPEHTFYAEPFAGAASVLLEKAPAAGGEILNDLNAEVLNLFSVMREEHSAAALREKLDWTLFSAAELELARQPSDDPIERARRLAVRSFMGITLAGVQEACPGFRMGSVDLRRLDYRGRRTFRNCAHDWNGWRENLGAIQKRLSKVMIYQRDAIDFIGMMSTPHCLLYVDPPYYLTTRCHEKSGARYAVEFGPHEHRQLVECLLETSAMVVLSGYPHPVYRPLEKAGWRRVDKDYRANMSMERRTECLWISPNIQAS